MRKAQAWNQPCPNPDCTDYQPMNRGNSSAISTYLTASGKRRIVHCKTCEQNFSETRDTVFFDLRTPEEKVMLAQAPHPELVSAQGITEKENGRLKNLTQRVLCGAARLKPLGLTISTSLIERVNLTMRPALAPRGRKSWSFCKDREQMRRRIVFLQAFDNFARPHQSLRV